MRHPRPDSSGRRVPSGWLTCAALVLVLVTCAGCDQYFDLWVLNDSGSTVVLDVHGPLNQTVIVPPHAYGGVFGSLGPPKSSWTVATVTTNCSVIATMSVDPQRDLIYIGPSGEASYVSGLAWEYGTRTAQQATLPRRDPACP